MVNGVNSAAGQTNTTTQGSSSLGKDDFMKLLIQQMKHQDPMNPMDGTQFAAQLAQFSSLEQLQNLNTSMTNSINANFMLTQSINNTLSSTLIGKAVKIGGSDLNYTGQDSVQMGYKLPANASSVEVNIYDANGQLVKTISDLPKSLGDNKLSWDFTDNNGNKVQEGSYTFEVKAKDLSGEDITTTSYKYGLVSGIRFTDSGTKLVVDNSEYNFSDILEVIDPATQGGSNG